MSVLYYSKSNTTFWNLDIIVFIFKSKIMEKVESDQVIQVFISCWNSLMFYFLTPCEEVYCVTLTDVYSDLPDSYLCVLFSLLQAGLLL